MEASEQSMEIVSGRSLIWLASYPKSGNTWVREIATQMFFGGADRMKAIPTYHKAAPETFSDIERDGETCVIAKTHLKHEHENLSLLSNRANGVILIRRHPLDVLLSTLNYARVENAEGVFLKRDIKTVEQIIEDGEIGHYIDQFLELGCSPWFKVATGNMADFVEGWRQAVAPEHLLELVYEDLIADPKANVQRIADFFGGDFTEAQVDQVLSESDRKTAQNGTFFWKRRSYNFEKMLPEKHITHFKREGAAFLERLGYGE